jgi:tRNA modification GTPase
LSEDGSIEVHCHGGSAAIERIVGDLRVLGAEPANDPSCANESLLAAEVVTVLGQCTTQRMAAIAMDQVRGALESWSLRWLGLQESVSSVSESREQVLADLRSEAIQIARWGEIGVRLGVPFRVVLVGAPNVGKSTIMNRIVGWDRSITYNEAGTTRDILHASTVLDGLPIRLTDTAGIRSSDEAIEREGVRRSENEIDNADVVVTVADKWALGGSVQPPESIASALRALARQQRWIRVLNKADRLSPNERSDADQDSQLIQTVATIGDGIDRLQRAITNSISMRLPPANAAVPVSIRQQTLVNELTSVKTVAEAIQLLHELRGQPARRD